MPRLPHRPRLGLLGTFGLASALPIALLGIALGHYLTGQTQRRALSNARQAALLTSRLGVQPLLTPADLRNGLPPERFEVLVECQDEGHQREVFDRLTGEGLKCRVLTF